MKDDEYHHKAQIPLWFALEDHTGPYEDAVSSKPKYYICASQTQTKFFVVNSNCKSSSNQTISIQDPLLISNC